MNGEGVGNDKTISWRVNCLGLGRSRSSVGVAVERGYRKI
jgi:hypothetical protein